MKRIMIFIFAFYLGGQLVIPDALSQGGSPMDLTAYQWKNRLLMVFASSPDDPNYRSLIKEMKEQPKGLNDRDVLVFEIFEKAPSLRGDLPLPKPSADFLREKFSARPGSFLVILIGKDGEEKLRRQKVNLTELFAVIDAMPMRQREMNERNQKPR